MVQKARGGEVEPIDAPAHFLVVEAPYYPELGDMLLSGAGAALAAAGATFDVVRVPGALEIPAAVAICCEAAEKRGRPYGGAVALGCIVRGETYHFEIVANESARGLMQIAAGQGLPDRQWHPDSGGRWASHAACRSRPGQQGRRSGARRHGALAAEAGRRGGPMTRGEQRAAARLAAVQALYQMDVAKTGINEILAEFESHWIGQEVEGDQYNPAEIAFFRDTLEGRSWPSRRNSTV